jgi:rhamnogalacturonyl hydrolase YesR
MYLYGPAMHKHQISVLAFTLLFLAFTFIPPALDLESQFGKISKHLKTRLSSNPSPTLYPHSYSINQVEINVKSSDWRSGFYPGVLWYMYDYTKDPYWRKNAELWTSGLEQKKYNTRTHDLGFMLYSSFGNGFRLTKNPNYKAVLIQGAKSLASRYDPKVGCIRSWDHGNWNFPVIIDNMMNLELLFKASKISGDPSFYSIAVSHAKSTLRNHFRKNGSSYHVVDYDNNGKVISKSTAQGYSNESSWARGQAWGLYGFIMTYRETHDPQFLAQAEKIANYIIGNLPKNKIPYWDLTAPNIPFEFQDASAAAIISAALLELSQFSEKNGKEYFNMAEEILITLSSPSFFASENTNGNFLLMHCIGNMPERKQINDPLIYADYYYLESLVRYSTLSKNRNKE